MRLVNLCGVAALATFVITGAAMPGSNRSAPAARSTSSAVVSYTSERALRQALERHPARVVRRIHALQVAELRPAGEAARFALEIAREPGITRVEQTATRRSAAEPSLAASPEAAFQWQYAATHADLVPDAVTHATAGITLAVIDTGADLAAPDLAAKAPLAYNVRARSTAVSDPNGHGTFVASLAAGSTSNGDGIAGSSGDARLMVIEAADRQGSFTDLDEAAAIVYAVDHGARIINLSLGGPTTSSTERRAVDYAVAKGVLLVAAIGNSHGGGNPVEYPAALLQPVGSRGVGGRGLSVGASTEVWRTCVVLQHRHAHLTRSAWRSRLRRRLSRILRVALSADQPSGLGHGELRVCQRYVVCDAAGRRCCSARLGGKPPAPRQGRRSDSQAHGLRGRKVEPAARLRRPRRRCSRGSGAGVPGPLEPGQASTRSMWAPRFRRRSSMRS